MAFCIKSNLISHSVRLNLHRFDAYHRVCGRLSNMKKMVFKLAIQDEKSKRRTMKAIAPIKGVDSVAVDMNENNITVIGKADPVLVGNKLKKLGFAELQSVSPVKRETPAGVYNDEQNQNYAYRPWPYQGYSSYTAVRDEDPNVWTIW